MTTLQNDTFLKALHRQPTTYTPVWMMRQAGRYLPEYRATRQKAGDFLSLCKNPNFATEVTLQPLDRYPLLDASIIFSDILTVPDAMGLGLYFVAGEGPKFERPLREEADIYKLKIPDIGKDLKYVIDAVSQIKKALQGRVPLIGFSGSPWTLATYMIEGQGGTDFLTIKKMAYSRPDLLHHILKTTTEAVTQYWHAQIKAGVDAIMIFDSWGGALSHQGYLEFSLPYMKVILSSLKMMSDKKIPSIMFTKGGGLWLEDQVSAGSDALGLDWQTDIKIAREKVGNRLAIQGNLDPAILLSKPEAIEKEVVRILDGYGHGHGHIFNLGHGITEHTPPEHVDVMLTTVREYSQQFHTQ
ncbi:uroporphyrinogen decarboxylase [Candidatus Methylopumilus planktonicus]|uniref:uroporphyrinogen decarboxylase n=1 Tax=Candidatus Methylopumilus planktonicus TaxID=1581557 RepID=UPI00111FBACD|nr:uroporphyrinogen decarboxylase [Candidatus Methylopumilus planktonicus]QDD10140.1 uroporphyrinogen decarboxylase [Candidatus Methylopumilus planktonicus]